MNNITPMMKQYLEIKEEHKDAILFFRLGDFYEMFFDDAIVASRILEIALTGKSYGMPERAPMCGVPFHSAEAYIQKLISEGKKVAICEQVEDPKEAKGIVKREVVKVITPGTNINNNNLHGYEDVYLMSICLLDDFCIAYTDVTTGEINVATIEREQVKDFINLVSPREILLHPDTVNKISKTRETQEAFENIKNSIPITVVAQQWQGAARGHLEIENTLEKFEGALDMIVGYIKETQGTISSNLIKINVYEKSEYLKIDPNSRKNLELTENATTRQKKNSLFDMLDYSVTSLGKRTLRKWIENPLKDLDMINQRLDIIEEMNASFDLREDLKELLNQVYDLERITGKISYGTLTTRDIVSLRTSLEVIPSLLNIIRFSEFENLNKLIKDTDPLEDIYEYLHRAVVDEPGISLKDGEIIRSEYNESLKEYRHLESNVTTVLNEMEQAEKLKTGIKSLKIGYNKVFGYYIEITHASGKDGAIPENYIRKQTLANAERYINQELKELEDKILGARQKIFEIQSEIYEEVRETLLENIVRINATAGIIGRLDALMSLSIASIEHHMVRPSFNKKSETRILSSRHPVVENIIGEERFVPNDIIVDEDSKVQIITGPNMGGKSTYMRQAAIIMIMAHMGSFVTAKSADIPLLDAIFTRIGASDDLSLGESTFMVEMKEVAYILKNATKDSLIILDEVGRGTSTFDGMSIAWAIIDYISSKLKSTTLFSTHYHEITDLEDISQNIKNHYIAVEDNGEDIRFLHKIMRGKMDKSYGIHVAKIAGLPDLILKNAENKLYSLENIPDAPSLPDEKVRPYPGDKNQLHQLSFNDYSYESDRLRNKIKDIDMDDISPREAYAILDKLKAMIEEGNL